MGQALGEYVTEGLPLTLYVSVGVQDSVELPLTLYVTVGVQDSVGVPLRLCVRLVV